jgi:hypothetical protein
MRIRVPLAPAPGLPSCHAIFIMERRVGSPVNGPAPDATLASLKVRSPAKASAHMLPSIRSSGTPHESMQLAERDRCRRRPGWRSD